MKVYNRDGISARIARLSADLLESMVDSSLIVNLGVGFPTIVSDYLHNPRTFFHTENGMLGMGPTPAPEYEDLDITDAGSMPVSETPGCAYFDSAESFAIIRGGHVDVTIIGAFEVDSAGYIANWSIPGGDMLGVGGAMDLICGAKTVVVAMSHRTKEGSSKLVKKCSLPLTGNRSADYVVTEFGVFRFADGKITLISTGDDINTARLQEITEADFEVSAELKRLRLSDLH